MKRWCCVLLPCLVGMTFLGGYVSPQDRKYVDYFLRLQAADLFRTKAFLLKSSSAYVSRKMLERVDLRFSYFRALTWDQARNLIVSVALDLVNKINSDSMMKAKNILPEPFTVDQLYLEIRTDNFCAAGAESVSIERVILNNGQLTYHTYPASILFYGRTRTYKESFQQALMLLDLPTEFDAVVSDVVVAPKPERTIEQSQIPAMTPSQEEVQRSVEPAKSPLMKPMTTQPQHIDVESENALGGGSKRADDLVGMIVDTISSVLTSSKGETTVQRQKVVIASFPPSSHQRGRTIAIECVNLPSTPIVVDRAEKWQVAVFPDAPQPMARRTVEIEGNLYQRVMALLASNKQKHKEHIAEQPVRADQEDQESTPQATATKGKSLYRRFIDWVSPIHEKAKQDDMCVPKETQPQMPESPRPISTPPLPSEPSVVSATERVEAKPESRSWLRVEPREKNTSIASVQEPISLRPEQVEEVQAPSEPANENRGWFWVAPRSRSEPSIVVPEEVLPNEEATVLKEKTPEAPVKSDVAVDEVGGWWRVAPRAGSRLTANDQVPQQANMVEIPSTVDDGDIEENDEEEPGQTSHWYTGVVHWFRGAPAEKAAPSMDEEEMVRKELRCPENDLKELPHDVSQNGSKGVLDRCIASLQSFWGHEDVSTSLDDDDDDAEFDDDEPPIPQAEEVKGKGD